MESWKLTIDKLMTENCLLFGHHLKFTSKKVARYLLGTRDTTEIFKLYELRYLLLKIYPLIHNLFHNPRVNPEINSQNLDSVKKHKKYKQKALFFKNKFSFIVNERNIPPQILFASVTPVFADIISKASQICNMPGHTNRWLNGSITAALTQPFDNLGWQYPQDLTQEEIFQAVSKQWGSNKENAEKIKEKIKHYHRSRWPSLLVIPDISNNNMILKEARTVGLPVIGLVNSNCLVEIDYPIFAQDQTIQSVHFFCHFLALLIAKESVYVQHKRYTLQNASSKIYTPKKWQKPIAKVFLATRKKLVSAKRKKKKFKLNAGIKFQKIKEPWKKPFFFNIVRPWQNKISRRHFLPIKLRKYYPFSSKTYSYRKQKFQESLLYLNLNAFIKQLKRKQMQKLKRKPKTQRSNLKNLKRKTLSLKKKSHFFYLCKKLKMNYVGRKTVFKKDTRTFEQKHSFLVRDKKLFHNEYKKKYFQKDKQTNEEKKQIHHKLRNFLWFSKMMQLLKKHHHFFPKWIPYPATPYYFKHSLKQWSQNFKWNDDRTLFKRVLNLQLQKKKEKVKYKPLLSERAYRKHPRDYKKRTHSNQPRYNPKKKNFKNAPKNLVKNKWGTWMKQNEPKHN